MARTTGKCGKAEVDYDDRCSYICVCEAGGKCSWSVTCPAPGGDTITTSGSGRETGGDGRPHFGYDGTAGMIGAELERISGYSVVVPEELRDERITGQIDGDMLAAAEKLGFSVTDKPASNT